MGSTDSADPQTARLLRLQTAFHDASELDPDARAAWAKAHLDVLADPVLPQSPDRLS